MYDVSIDLPLSKSQLNRVMILAAAQGKFSEWMAANPQIQALGCRDTQLLSKALQTLEHGETEFDFQDAGTPSRLFTAYAAVCLKQPVIITGNNSLNQRSVSPLVDALRIMGAEIEYLKQEGFTPIQIRKPVREWKTVTISNNISSQFVSALLLVAPIFKGRKEIQITEASHSMSYIQLTLETLKSAGILTSEHPTELKSEVLTTKVVVERTYAESTNEITSHIEADWSSAAFFYPLLLGMPKNTSLMLKHLSLNSHQGDVAMRILGDTLGIATQQTQVGVIISRTKSSSAEDGTECNQISEELQTTAVEHKESLIPINLSNNPDLAPALLIAWSILGKTLTIQGLNNLRHKECDRILAMQENLSMLNCRLVSTNESADLWLLDASQRSFPMALHVNTFEDHRIAMAFACLKPWVQQLTFTDSTCVEKSFPQFWEQWKKCTFE
jgi:3-phosphoshikimate 1-carboxyvinyltransferase